MKLFKLQNFKTFFLAAAVFATVGLWGSAGFAEAQTNKPAPTPSPSTTMEDPCDKLQAQIDAGGFNISDLPKYCSIESVYNKFLSTALYAVGIVAVIAIIYGGYVYMTAQSNDVQRKKGRDILTWAVIGLALVIVAVLLVNVVINLIVENKFV